MTGDLPPAEALAKRFSALASALGVDVEAAKRVASDGDDAAVLGMLAEIAGQDSQAAIEILMASLQAVLPMVTGSMSDARRANVLRALATRLLVEADRIHPRQGEDG